MDALARFMQRKRNKVLINTSTTLELLSKVDGFSPLFAFSGTDTSTEFKLGRDKRKGIGSEQRSAID